MQRRISELTVGSFPCSPGENMKTSFPERGRLQGSCRFFQPAPGSFVGASRAEGAGDEVDRGVHGVMVIEWHRGGTW